MFNSRLKNKIKQLEEENEQLKLLLDNISIVVSDNINDDSYASLIKRIIEHAKSGEYNVYQEKLLSFIVSELNVMRDNIQEQLR